jgi:hypothetical protein
MFGYIANKAVVELKNTCEFSSLFMGMVCSQLPESEPVLQEIHKSMLVNQCSSGLSCCNLYYDNKMYYIP